MNDDGRPLDAIELGERVARELGHVAERREYHFAGLKLAGRRRRPSGERPPLPRELKASGKFWLGAAFVVLIVWFSLFAWPATTNWWTEQDLKVLNWLVELRNDVLTTISKAVHVLGSAWFIRPLRWGVILTLVFFKRFRAMFGVLGSIALVAEMTNALAVMVARPRPLVDMLGDWQGYSHPSRPVAALAVTLAIVGLALIPKCRWRRPWFLMAGLLVLALGISRMYLGVDHPSDVWTAAMLGFAVPFVVFRL
ncbi:MAG: phosphatase PAP2 family protein, partial [Acidimicrobiia bacterium]|nr:phosphatase PAP2 family protein [Acidimicrobiia bacterium]